MRSVGEQGQGVGPEATDQLGDQGNRGQADRDNEAARDAAIQQPMVVMTVVMVLVVRG